MTSRPPRSTLISDFVKAFWFWEKTPTEALRTEGPQIEHSAKKSPAQLQREIDEVLARPVNGKAVEDLALTPAQRAYVSAVEEDVRRYPDAYKAYVRADPAKWAMQHIEGFDDAEVRRLTREQRAETKRTARLTGR